MIPKVLQVLAGPNFTVLFTSMIARFAWWMPRNWWRRAEFLLRCRMRFFPWQLTVINDTVAWDIDGNRDPCALYDICPIVENPLKEVIRAGPYSLNIACQELSRLAGRKDLPNTLDRVTIPQTQIHEKNASGPGPADICRPWSGSVFDPIFDHSRGWNTWKQRI